MQALYIASTGMMAQETNVEVISNNIANMRTAGFKKQRAEFQDLLYQNLRRVGAETSEQGTLVPSGVQIGSGVMTAATPRIMSQGLSNRPTKSWIWRSPATVFSRSNCLMVEQLTPAQALSSATRMARWSQPTGLP